MINNGQHNSSPLLIWIWISRTRFMSLKLVELKEKKKVHKICLNLVEHHHAKGAVNRFHQIGCYEIVLA